MFFNVEEVLVCFHILIDKIPEDLRVITVI